MSALGHGMERDFQEAAKWYRRAAEQGDADAQYNLGVMYDRAESLPASARSRGIAQDYGEAARWYRLSADQGNADAQFNLGILYSNGQGVPHDLVQAHMWFSLAAVSGDADAIENRDGVAEKMTAAELKQAQALARSWKPKKKP